MSCDVMAIRLAAELNSKSLVIKPEAVCINESIEFLGSLESCQAQYECVRDPLSRHAGTDPPALRQSRARCGTPEKGGLRKAPALGQVNSYSMKI